MANRANQGLVCIGARVEPELADAITRLADSGDRWVSREVRRALLDHVAATQEASPTRPVAAGSLTPGGGADTSPPAAPEANP